MKKNFLAALSEMPKRGALLLLLLAGALIGGGLLMASTSDYDLAQSPLYLGKSEPPLMMLVMSRDEQLFNKAYSDYTNLQEGQTGDDGKIDTTYTDSFDYAGYFDSNLCYGYDNGVFKASAVASGGTATAAGVTTGNHQCSSQWSGNFLNWVTMSRLDLLRYVLYGGKRSTDSLGASGTYQVILERAYIPNDLHAWVKVYSGSDIAKFTPYSTTTSFCNASLPTTAAPLMRVASGSYTEWASTALNQCNIKSASDSLAQNDVPNAVLTDYNVRVDVCGNSDATKRESFCRSYSDGTYTYYRPAGLLQEYGEGGRLRFGLISGSFDQPRAGGVLRRNIGLFSGNSAISTCATGDEVNTGDGRFCWLISSSSSVSASSGIVQTVDNFKLTNWSSNKWQDCGTYAILNRNPATAGNGYLNDPGASTGYACNAWGNPLAEMYAEALRYIAGGSKTLIFSTSTSADSALGLPVDVTWTDPYVAGGYSYCSTCSILVLSSGLPSFDANAVPAVGGVGGSNILGTDANSATTAVGSNEGLSGSNVFVGRDTAKNKDLTMTYADYCQSVNLSGLGNALGLCPDSPSTEGSYLIAGLAHKAASVDMRSDLVSTQKKNSNYHNTVTTYAVQMSESLPSFQIPVGGSTITLSPLCQSNNTGTATAASSGWRTCSLGSVAAGATTSIVSPKYIYGRDLVYDGTKLVSGSYKLVWEDSLWGNDHDNDMVTMLSFCVGAACTVSNSSDYHSGNNICWRTTSASTPSACSSTTVGTNEAMVRVEVLSAYAGNALINGLIITGSNGDGTMKSILRPGNTSNNANAANNSLISTLSDPPASWGAPVVYRLTANTSASAIVPKSPLWYAAKYGNPDDLDSAGVPVSKKWDSGTTGTPDGYFLAHNPTLLKTSLEKIFSKAAGSSTVAGSASEDAIDSSTFSVKASFSAGDNNDWTGDVVASTTSTGTQLWNAATKLAATTWSSRKILATLATTVLKADGSVATASTAGDFIATNVPGTTQSLQFAALGLNSGNGTTSAWLGSQTVESLVNYLKGNTNSAFRARTSLLGDIVNSAPVMAQGTDDYGWYAAWSSIAALSTYATGYKNYLVDKKTRTPAVYVGANDGMLHAFNGSITGNTGGQELFAFIPTSSWRHMGELANPNYDHRYFVDGPQTLGDAYYGSGWHTVLVGSTGAGGAATTNANTLPQGSVYGLDVSNPSSFSAGNVLWELSGRNNADLGQVVGAAVVVPVRWGTGIKFVAIFGNGVNSTNGNPVLYVVDVQTGQVLRRLQPTVPAYLGSNGIINIAAAALSNTSGLADTVYAGDLRGNLWKFDLSNADSTKWSVAFNGAPLFQATDSAGKAQPITGHLLLKSGTTGGMMVYFGTGRYLATGDVSNTDVQSLYGVLDNLSTTITDRSVLVGQALASSTSSTTGYATRSVSSNTVNYAIKRGWYIDLSVTPGERFIGTPYLLSGVVYFATYFPTVGGDCTGGGENWEYGLGVINGGGNLSSLVDASGRSVCSGTCGAVKLTSSSTTTSVAPITQISWLRNQTVNTGSVGLCSLSNVVAGTSTGLNSTTPCGRQSWRQLR